MVCVHCQPLHAACPCVPHHLHSAQFLETLESGTKRPPSCEDQDNSYLVCLGSQHTSTIPGAWWNNTDLISCVWKAHSEYKCPVLGSLRLLWWDTWRKQRLGGKYEFWLIVTEISVHGELVPLLLEMRHKQHGGRKATQLMVTRKQRESKE